MVLELHRTLIKAAGNYSRIEMLDFVVFLGGFCGLKFLLLLGFKIIFLRVIVD